MKQSKWLLALAAALVLSVAVLQAQSAGESSVGADASVLKAIPVATHSLLDLHVDSSVIGGTEITLATDGDVEYRTQVLEGPDRLVLDLVGVISRLDRYRLPVGGSGVVRVRSSSTANVSTSIPTIRRRRPRRWTSPPVSCSTAQR